jgi:uroporphyrinogen decarboxylase
MRLIDTLNKSSRRLVAPLAGYPGVQLTKSTIKQNEFNVELQARSLYKLAEFTQPDMIFPMMDLSIEAGSLGLPVRFPLEESATVEWHPVQSVADLEQYKVIDPLYDGRVWVFVETVRLLSRWLEMPVGAYVIGPFTLAGLMMGATNIALATLDSPAVVGATVNFCERVVIDYAKALQEAGAKMICILDPTAVILSPAAFWEFAGCSIENVVRHLNTPTVLHVCGNTENLLSKMCETGVQGLSLDSVISLPRIAPKVPSDMVLIGNIDPVGTMLQGDVAKVERETTGLLEAMRPYPNFMASTGCDLPAETPLENIRALVETVKGFR